MSDKKSLPKVRIHRGGSQKIDWQEIKDAYMQSATMGVQPFLVNERGWSLSQAKNGNTTKQTVGRQVEKINTRKEIEARSLDILKADEVKKRVENTRLLYQYYTANTKAILAKIKDAQDNKIHLSIKDRIEINREIRTQLGLPNNITGSLPPMNPNDDLENPAEALLSIIDGEYEIQNTVRTADGHIDDQKGSTN